MSFNAERAYADMEALAFPRRTGSPGATRAREYVLSRLRDAGLAPHVEPFVFGPLLLRAVVPAVVLGAAGLVLAAALAYPALPRAALVLLLLGFVAGLPATRWSYAVERILDWGEKRESANIIAELPAPDEARRHVILMAHYDSKSQRLPIAVRSAAAVGALAGGCLLLLGVVLGALGGATFPDWPVVAAGAASAAGLVVVGLNPCGNRSPGALDNAAGTGVLLELARVAPGQGLRHTRVTLVATGAEEEGLVGAVRFLQAHREDLGPEVTLINLDSPGAAPGITLLSAFGLPPMGGARDLMHRARDAARAEGIPIRSLWMPAGVGTDHFPAALRRIPAVTISSLGRSFGCIHTPHDTPAGVCTEGLDAAGRLALALLQALDAGA